MIILLLVRFLDYIIAVKLSVYEVHWIIPVIASRYDIDYVQCCL